MKNLLILLLVIIIALPNKSNAQHKINLKYIYGAWTDNKDVNALFMFDKKFFKRIEGPLEKYTITNRKIVIFRKGENVYYKIRFLSEDSLALEDKSGEISGYRKFNK